MADGLARATGEVGVVLVTSGPGATNAITGIATAYMDSISCPFRAGSDLVDRLRCFSGVRHGGDFATGG